MCDKNQWISVKDWLPVNDKQVLVFWKSIGIRIARYDRVNGDWISSGTTVESPKYWAPLPELPHEPDAFEAWCSGRMWSDEHIHVQDKNDAIDAVTKRAARVIWDAAVAATKDGKR